MLPRIIRVRREHAEFRFKLAIAVTAMFLLLFSFERLLMFVLNFDTFSKIPTIQLIWGFLHGIKFDFATIALFVLPFVFLLILPVRSVKWIKVWTTLLISEFILAGAMLSADLIYFGYVKRHMGEELLSLGNDLTFIVGYIFGPGLPTFLLLIAALIGLIWAINRFLDKHYRVPEFKGFSEILLYLVFVGIIFIGITGGFTKYPLNIPDAYVSTTNSNVANLSLNGIFTSYHVIRKGNYISENTFPINKAIEITSDYLIQPDEIVPLPYQYPLMRHKNLKAHKRMPNLVIIALESWVPQYIDGVEGTYYGVTPVFDKLLSRGMYFDNFYAFELRSIQGIAAILTGTPALPKLPKLGYGLEKAGLTKLPEILNSRGYRTIFAQTSMRASFNLCDTALKMGFKEAYGMEDMPKQFDYVKQEGYGYDYDMYHLLAEKLKDNKEPFFFFGFTGITHMPYLGNLEGFNKYPNTTEQNKYLNSMYYADYSIGYLMEQAKAQGWLDNTVFIFVADHTFNRKGNILEKYNIPMLIYGPNYIKVKRVQEVGSQLDILPTVMEILRLDDNYTAAGKSLLAGGPRVALFADGYTIGLITNEGGIRHTRSKPLEAEEYAPDFKPQTAEEMLLSLDKTYYTLLREDRWQQVESNEKQ